MLTEKGDPRPIGVFDSGIGGLSVVRALRELLPNEQFIYVGDTAHAPYGGLSPETLLTYSRDIVLFLLKKNVKAVVIACGTSSSTAYETLKTENPDLILVDVIRPGVTAVKSIWLEKPDTQFGFVATAATVKKGLFVKLLKEEYPGISIKARACPLFAPLAERGLFASPVTRWAAETYLHDWKENTDALILGCTHYPLLSTVLKQTLPAALWVDIFGQSAAATQAELTARYMLRTSPHPPQHEYYTSGPVQVFNALAGLIMKETVKAGRL